MSEFLGVLVLSCILWFGGKLVLDGGMGLQADSFITYILFFTQIINPAKSLSGSFYSAQRGSAAIQRIEEVLKAPVTVTDQPDAKTLEYFEQSIEFKNVSFSYEDVTILKNINLKIEKGKTIALVGSSGAGKSTLLRFPNLLERPDKGSIFFEGKDITGIKGKELQIHRQKIGMVFQHFNLLSNRTVFDNIAFPLRVSKTPSSQIQKRVKELLALTEISEKENHYPSQLSGGQKQRVGIARALANHPKLLLCDEPTSALDPETTRSILRLLKQIRDELSLTILIVTHEMQVVRDLCDKTAIMDKGFILEENDTETFFSQAKSEITKKIIGSGNGI